MINEIEESLNLLSIFIEDYGYRSGNPQWRFQQERLNQAFENLEFLKSEVKKLIQMHKIELQVIDQHRKEFGENEEIANEINYKEKKCVSDLLKLVEENDPFYLELCNRSSSEE